MDVQAYRDYVWSFLQLDAEELPVPLIDRWIREGFNRIVAVTKRFPFYEATETVALTGGEQLLTVTTVAPDKIESISHPDGMLQWMGHSEAQRKFHPSINTVSTRYPLVWSRYGGQLFLWPVPSADQDVTVTGWRAPEYGWLALSGGVPDMDEQLQEPLLSFVMHKAYEWDDDPERSAAALGSFQSGVDEILGAIVEEVPTSPIVLHGGKPRISGIVEPRWLVP